MFGESFDKLHGSGRKCRSGCCDCGGGGSRIWRSNKERETARWQRGSKWDSEKQGGRTAKRQGNSCFKEKVDCILRISCSADVLFDGAYDVGMAGSENTGRESCGDGTAPDAAYDCGHDCQSEIFCQWIQRIVASGSEYGYTCGTWLRCFICV